MRSEFFREIAESRKRFLIEAASELGIAMVKPVREIASDKPPSGASPHSENKPRTTGEPALVSQPEERMVRKSRSKISQLLSLLSF